jgi:hypothetical protein
MTSHRIESLSRLIDAATTLALTTATLYFLGFSYYSTFCEKLGFRFYGIAVPFADYLVIGWHGVFVVILILVAALMLIELFVWWINRDRSRGKDGLDERETPLSNLIYIRLGVVIMYLLWLLLFGATDQAERGERDASNVAKELRMVVVRDISGVVIPGNFAYLRDFGGAIAVDELSVNNKSILGVRIIKAGSYSSYTLLNSSANTLLKRPE